MSGRFFSEFIDENAEAGARVHLDLDGTLADTMPSHSWPGPRWRPDRAEFSGSPVLFAGWRADGQDRGNADHGGRAGARPQAIALEKEQTYYEGLGQGGIRAIEPVLALARGHRERNEGPLAIASGSVGRLVTRTLAALGITDWFDAVVAAEDTARHKPEPDVFLEAARRMNAAPATCTVYEDTDIGLEAARRAGMRPVDVRPLIAAAT